MHVLIVPNERQKQFCLPYWKDDDVYAQGIINLNLC